MCDARSVQEMGWRTEGKMPEWRPHIWSVNTETTSHIIVVRVPQIDGWGLDRLGSRSGDGRDTELTIVDESRGKAIDLTG